MNKTKQNNNQEMQSNNIDIKERYFGHFIEFMKANNIDPDIFTDDDYRVVLLQQLYYDYNMFLVDFLQKQAKQQNSGSKLLVPDYVAKNENDNKVIKFPLNKTNE